jgi:hypothetical protein
MPQIHVRGPGDAGFPAGGPVVITGTPNSADLQTARADVARRFPGQPILYVISDNAATLVLMSTLWQLGISPPDVKLRGPELATPPVIYGIPREPEIIAREEEAAERWANAHVVHLIAETPTELVFLQWVWQSGPF